MLILILLDSFDEIQKIKIDIAILGQRKDPLKKKILKNIIYPFNISIIRIYPFKRIVYWKS